MGGIENALLNALWICNIFLRPAPQKIHFQNIWNILLFYNRTLVKLN